MIDVFDIIGPIMVGPSSSHTAGAARIGRMARTLLGCRPVKARIGLYGSFAETGEGHGTDKALIAGLLNMKPDDLRIPDSFELAKEADLEFDFYTAVLKAAHPNTAVIDVTGDDGHSLHLQAVSVGGGQIRVERLGDVEVNFTGEMNTLVVRHKDVTGIIMKVTTILAWGSVNIATISDCRSSRNGDSIMVLEVDQKVQGEIIDQLMMIPYVQNVVYYEREND